MNSCKFTLMYVMIINSIYSASTFPERDYPYDMTYLSVMPRHDAST